MSELLTRGLISSYEILKSCEALQLPSGDTFYASSFYAASPYRQLPDEPFKLLVSPEGQQFIDRPDFVNLVDLSVVPPIGRKFFSGHHGFTTREEYLGLRSKAAVAVKRIYLQYLTQISGFDYFQAMKDLIKAGFYCASPLLATRDRFVSQWIDGVNAGADGTEQLKDSDFTFLLMSTVKDLQNSGRWPKRWRLDTYSENFFIRNPRAANPKERYTIIDPIYASSPYSGLVDAPYPILVDL